MSTSVPQARMGTTQLHGANGAIEGWRAVLSVVLRYGMGQRQRMSTARSLVERPEEPVESSAASTSGTIPEDEAMDVDGINAMMAGVKSRGVGFCLSEFCALTDIRYTLGQGIIEVRQGSVGLIALGGC